jgi:hypothetical protein
MQQIFESMPHSIFQDPSSSRNDRTKTIDFTGYYQNLNFRF